MMSEKYLCKEHIWYNSLYRFAHSNYRFKEMCDSYIFEDEYLFGIKLKKGVIE